MPARETSTRLQAGCESRPAFSTERIAACSALPRTGLHSRAGELQPSEAEDAASQSGEVSEEADDCREVESQVESLVDLGRWSAEA